jgi:hypothetical protein
MNLKRDAEELDNILQITDNGVFINSEAFKILDDSSSSDESLEMEPRPPAAAMSAGTHNSRKYE